MSVLHIRLLGDTVLRQKAKPVYQVTSVEKKLLDDMVGTMIDAEGAGLAAPQVGVSKRMIVARVDEDEILQIINPEITFRSQETDIAVEGCLSIPGFQAEIERSLAIQVKGQDGNGETVEFQLEEYPARIVQHEVDHLEGRLYIDRFVPDTLHAISVEEDPETGEEECVLTPVTVEEVRAVFANPTTIPTRVKPVRKTAVVQNTSAVTV